MKKSLFARYFLCIAVVFATRSALADEVDDFNWDDIDDNFEEFAASIEYLNAHKRALSSAQVLNNLSSFGVISALKNNMYRHTYPLQSPPILDNPLFFERTHRTRNHYVTVAPFYNEQRKMLYTAGSKNISGYLDFTDPNVLRNSVAQALGIDMERLLSLFSPLKIEERQTGSMIGGLFKVGRWKLAFKTPVIYQERNFFITEKEQRAIEDAEVFNDDSQATGNSEEFKAFAVAHFVSDKLGIGDTRIYLTQTLHKAERFKVYSGFDITLPTAFTFAKGVIGGTFPKDASAPRTTLDGLLNTAQTNIVLAKKEFITYLTTVLDRFSSILLERSLGNDGHLGVGASLETKLWCGPHLFVTMHTAAEYLLPAHEWRHFLVRYDPKEFDRRDFDTSDANEQADHVAFLNRRLQHKLFPPAYRTTIQPGAIFRHYGSLTYERRTWNATAGYTFWGQTREHLLSIDAPGTVGGSLQKEEARIFGGMYQVNTFCHLGKRMRWKRMWWDLKLKGSITLAAEGTGKNLSGGLTIGTDF